MSVTVILAFVALPLIVFFKILFDYAQSSVSSLPGPWYTRFTDIPFLYARLVGTSRHYLQRLHKIHGSVVRVGPKDVSVNSIDGYYRIHGVGSHCTKTPVFDKIRFSHSPMLFTMRDPQAHAQRKRILGRSLTAVRADQETTIRRLVELAISQIKTEAEDGRVDVYKWWRCLAVDVMTEMAFGQSFDLLESGGQDSPVFKALEKVNMKVMLQAILPEVLMSPLRWSPIAWVRDVVCCTEVMFGPVMAALGELRHSPKCTTTMLGRILSKDNSKSRRAALDDDEMGSEAAMMIVAGSDSTAATLTYAVWEVLRHPTLRQQVEDEVAALRSGFTAKEVEALPLLSNILEEVLRLYNPTGAPVERLVPTGGISVDGWDIPGGTTVYTQSWLLSRLQGVFPQPEKFDANRFANPTPELKRAHVPFSIGSRSCLGMNLARMEIRLALALFFRECKGARLHQSMTDDMMTQVGEFFIVPKAGRCDISIP
ncbi:hypothetical protein NW755_012221 [Fusarium falciforme]|uniref:Cytochrome P450 monooxygenase n=1 Tax=Fusarium falciforme TaxID=195108 RepID=A0A9W8QWZ0_9HYPO|nr:hypothetical protein NW755_012221 [Fusarium falciforme]